MGNLLAHIEEINGLIPNGNYIVNDEVTALDYSQYAIVINSMTTILQRLLDVL